MQLSHVLRPDLATGGHHMLYFQINCGHVMHYHKVRKFL